MREYEFNVKTMSWHKDEKGFDYLVVHCYDSESRLVLNCGGHQKRLVDGGAPDGLITDAEKPCA